MLVTLEQFLRQTTGLRDHQRRTNVLPFLSRSIDLIGRDFHENHSSDHGYLLIQKRDTDLECADLSALLKSGDESPHSKSTHPESCPTSLQRRGVLRDSIPRPAETRSSIHTAGMHRL